MLTGRFNPFLMSMMAFGLDTAIFPEMADRRRFLGRLQGDQVASDPRLGKLHGARPQGHRPGD